MPLLLARSPVKPGMTVEMADRGRMTEDDFDIPNENGLQSPRIRGD